MIIVREDGFKAGLNFLMLGLYAFAGLGLEVLLAFFIEPSIYNRALNDFSTGEILMHWIITCTLWSMVAYMLVKTAKAKYNYDVFWNKNPVGLKNLLWCFGILVFSVVVSYLDWNGFKIIKEFLYNGWLKFIFQYIYYFFEVMLVILIMVFGQRAGEVWFRTGNIPWGGILVALTWGLVHILTKGDLATGVLSALSSVLFGVVYLLCKKNIYLAGPIIFLIFIL